MLDQFGLGHGCGQLPGTTFIIRDPGAPRHPLPHRVSPPPRRLHHPPAKKRRLSTDVLVPGS